MIDPVCPASFVPEHVIGRGGCAVVWLARHVVTDQQVALKVWRRPLTDDDVRDRFVAEARLLAQFADEPHVVEVLWTSTPDDPLPWTAMRTAGDDLATWLRHHSNASLDERLDIADGLLAGLGALHRRGLVHRDVTPRNVLVDAAGHVRLCDFGLAMEVGGPTVDPVAGTPGHLAPELETTGAPTLATDVYCAAVTIDALLGTAATPAVEHVVATRALSHRPQDRPRDAEEFRRALAQARADDAATYPTSTAALPTVAARPPVDGEVQPDPITRRRPIMAGAILIAALLAVAGVTDRLGPGEDQTVAAAGASSVSDQASPEGPPQPFPGADAFRIGRAHPAVADLDHALIRLGCTRYHDGDGYQPSDRFTEYTRLNLRAFQLANPALAGQPDGYPGPRTWAMLFAASSIGCR